MERRQSVDRREVHAFASDERRKGPHDRRDAGARRLAREREQKKIQRIRAYKERNHQPPPAKPLMTQKGWTVLGIALVAVVVVLWLLT